MALADPPTVVWELIIEPSLPLIPSIAFQV